VTKPKDRECEQEPNLVGIMSIQQAAWKYLRCATCEWAVRPVGDECEEQKFVLGCIHWRRR
jgi:hypothetical protein